MSFPFKTRNKTMKLSIENNRALVVLFTVLTLSLSLNLYLGWRVRDFNATRMQQQWQVGVPVGTDLSSLPVFDIEGRPAQLNFKGSVPTVLYVLSPACGWCRKNEPNMQALAAGKSSNFHFVGISSTSKNLRQYVAAGHAPFTVYVASPVSVPGLDLQTTPQTLVVSPSGVVQKVWLGAFDGARKHEIESFFQIDLPGIKTQPSE